MVTIPLPTVPPQRFVVVVTGQIRPLPAKELQAMLEEWLGPAVNVAETPLHD